MRGTTACWADNSLSTMAEKPTREELGLKLWVISFHGAKVLMRRPVLTLVYKVN